MKKFILSLMMAMVAIFSYAQSQSNYVGSSKFTDNVSVTVQGGVLTSFDNFYSGHTAMAPVALIGVDKYITPVFGVGVEGRTLIGTGHGAYNTYTAFDYVNVSGYLKANLANAFNFTGTRHTFEPVIYTGIGWGHGTAYDHPNWMTYRAGVELNYNLGNSKNWAVVLNPSVVWNDIDNGKLIKKNGSFEVTAGVVYHFKTSNGTTSFAKAKLYDQNEVDELNSKVNGLKKQLDDANATIEVLKSNAQPKTNTVETVKVVYPKVQFKQGSAKVTETSMANIYDIADALKDVNGTIKVTGYASTEGTTKLNKELSLKRAEAVKKLLVKAGVSADKIEVVGNGATNKFNPDELNVNRIVTVEK